MGESSVLWLRVAAGLYSLGLLHAIIMVVRRHEGIFKVAFGAFGLAAVFQLVSLVEIGIAQHHFPANNIFETLSICSLAVTVGFLATWFRFKTASLSVFIFPLVFAMTLVSALGGPVSSWSNPTLRSTWLIVHIVLSLLGYASLLFTAVAAVAYLLQERQLKTKQPKGFSKFLPPLGMLDDLIFQSLGAGFVFVTASMIVITIWAYKEYGTAWLGDSRIGLSFITWGIYLALVFFRVSLGWRGRKTAILAIAAVCLSAATWVAHSNLKGLMHG